MSSEWSKWSQYPSLFINNSVFFFQWSMKNSTREKKLKQILYQINLSSHIWKHITLVRYHVYFSQKTLFVMSELMKYDNYHWNFCLFRFSFPTDYFWSVWWCFWCFKAQTKCYVGFIGVPLTAYYLLVNRNLRKYSLKYFFSMKHILIQCEWWIFFLEAIYVVVSFHVKRRFLKWFFMEILFRFRVDWCRNNWEKGGNDFDENR